MVRHHLLTKYSTPYLAFSSGKTVPIALVKWQTSYSHEICIQPSSQFLSSETVWRKPSKFHLSWMYTAALAEKGKKYIYIHFAKH